LCYRFLGVELSPALSPRFGGAASGVILLENPQQENLLDLPNLRDQVEKLFGLKGVSFDLAVDGRPLAENVDVISLAGKIVIVYPKGGDPSKLQASSFPSFSFVNVVSGNKNGTIVLTNSGRTTELVEKNIQAIFKKPNFKLNKPVKHGETVEVK